jgi:hypothetical protein
VKLPRILEFLPLSSRSYNEMVALGEEVGFTGYGKVAGKRT